MGNTKRFYVTTKQCQSYIDRHKKDFDSEDSFESALEETIKDLELYPHDNVNSIKFFTKVLKIFRYTKVLKIFKKKL